MAKKWIIDCGVCDARNLEEETLAAYDSITIDSGSVIVTPQSKKLLAKYNVTLDCGDIWEVPGDAQIRKINGSAQIRGTDVVSGRIFLMVNGSLEIGPDTQQVLEQYAGIKVNGSVTCPESVNACLGKIQVNGSVNVYPDDAIVLKRTAVIDRTFALRAKNRRYWSARRMIMVDPELDGAALAAKGATFSTKEVLLAKSKAEELVELIDERAEITILPDGVRIIQDDVELSDAMLRKYGTKLYILGDMMVSPEAGEALGKLEYLNIQGDVRVVEQWADLLRERAEEIKGDVEVIRGRLLEKKLSVRISREMLEREDIQALCCVRVWIDGDIPQELLLERLSIRDCVDVFCAPEQESVVGAISRSVVNISTAGDDKGVLGGVMDQLKARSDPDTKVTDAGEYVL